MLDRAEQHAAGAAGRVVDALARLRIEQLDHHPHDAARRVELARLLPPGDVGELADQVLVGVAQDVGRDRGVAQRHAGQALDEVLEELVAECLAVAPVGRAEDPGQRVGIRTFYGAHRTRQRGADVRRRLADVAPAAAVRQREAVQFRKELQIDIAESAREDPREGRVVVRGVSLPECRRRRARDVGIGCHERRPVQDRLRHEAAVERIGMRNVQVSTRSLMTDRRRRRTTLSR